MKESIGGTQLFIIVVTLVILFAGIMALTINRANAFAVKDKLVAAIEDHGYFSMDTDISTEDEDGVLHAIVEELKLGAYRQTGACKEYDYSTNQKIQVTAYNRDGTIGDENNASFCIARVEATKEGGIPIFYYELTLFYNLDLPVIKQLFNFKLVGQTKALHA